MQKKRVSLTQIMNSWMGEDVQLQVQGFTMIAVINGKFINKKFDTSARNGGGFFTKMSQSSIYNNSKTQKENYPHPHFSESDQQFVVRVNSRSPHRVSLANLGQIYISRKTSQSRSAHKYQTFQHYPQALKKYSGNSYMYNSGTKFTNQNNRQRIQQQNQNFYARNYSVTCRKQSSVLQKDPISTCFQEKYANENKNNMEQIMESINQIRLPDNQKRCPEYEKANVRFEKMKSQILHKIIKYGEVKQLQDILKQIRHAADQIINKHKTVVGAHNEYNTTNQLENKKTHSTNPTINKIDEIEDDKTQYVNLPQFNDEAGSISSIFSGNGVKKDDNDSKDDFKIDNIFINNVEIYLKDKSEQSSSGSIQPIVLQERNPKENLQLEEVKCEQKKQVLKIPKQITNIMKPKTTKPSLNAIKVSDTIVEERKKKEDCFVISKYTSNHNFKNNPVVHKLEKTATQAVKIVENLEQPRKIKKIEEYPELKPEELQTKTANPQIVYVSSPLRFRRKEQVVKHFVAAHIVEKESSSIEF